MRDKRTSEVTYGQAVVRYLAENGWEVYQEVKHSDRYADIVARLGHVTWVIECKVSNILAVFDQALGWTNYAHFVSVAVPSSCARSAGRALTYLCQATGIGLLRVSVAEFGDSFSSSVHEFSRPRLNRNIWRHKPLADLLRDEHKTWAPAGCKTGDRFSPWKETCRNLTAYVKLTPGCSMGEAVKKIGHHYGDETTARSALMVWIRDGKIPGIRREREGRKVRLFPTIEDTRP